MKKGPCLSLSSFSLSAVAIVLLLLSTPAPAAGTRVSGILDSLMVYHPGWVTRSVTSHDPRGLNNDGSGNGNPVEGEYRVLFHGKGEGRITRIWMTAGEKNPKDYKELWIIVDGNTAYKGKPSDFFDRFKAPLLMDYQDGAFISYMPFSYSREARILFKGDPHYFQVTYRQGPGSSSGPGYREIAEFLDEPWVENAPATGRKVTASAAAPAVLAKGPATIAALSLRCKPEDLSKLRIRVGGQPPVPAAFFFGLGSGAADPLKDLSPFRTAIHHIDAAAGLLITRLPIPLQEGEELALSVEGGEPVEAAYGLAAAAAKPGVRLIAQYRDQNGPGPETSMPFFEYAGPAQFVSLVEEIAGGLPGGRSYLEGGEIIRTDGMAYPLQLGTGTGDYFNGGRDLPVARANSFAGQPRLVSGGLKAGARFEHSLFRHHLLDPIVSRSDLRFGFEAGETGAYTPVRYRTLGLAYAFDSFRLVSRASADMSGKPALSAVDAERSQQPQTFQVNAAAGFREFSLRCPASFSVPPAPGAAGGRGVLLVRRYDSSAGGQEALLRISSRAVGSLFESYANPERSLAEDALWADLKSSDCADGFLRVSAEPAARPGGVSAPWNESGYDALFFDTDASPDAPLALKQGQNIRIFDAGLPGGPFYVNDHTIARGPDGRWHLTGIFHHELADPLNEIEFIHARAPAGDPSAWRGQDFTVTRGTADVTLSVDRSLGETHLWAPHIAHTGKDYAMAFHSGGPEEDSQIKIARSDDLETWRRSPLKPIFTDISTARDPMLFRAGDLWVMYYTRCDGAQTRLNGVAYRTSTDLENWSEPAMAMTLPKVPPLPNSGYTESPFVFERGGWYYLSVTSYPVEYDASFLYRSRSPFSFGDVSVARFKSHAPEWVEGGENPGYGPLFITHAGWGQGGVWLSPVTGW